MLSVVDFVQFSHETMPVTGFGAGIAWCTPGNVPSWATRLAPTPPYQPMR